MNSLNSNKTNSRLFEVMTTKTGFLLTSHAHALHKIHSVDMGNKQEKRGRGIKLLRGPWKYTANCGSPIPFVLLHLGRLRNQTLCPLLIVHIFIAIFMEDYQPITIPSAWKVC
jgi:hypothetical protein